MDEDFAHRRRLALVQLKAAVEFFDRVTNSSEDERIAVGNDHWEWLKKAARNAAQFATEEDE